LRPRSVGSAPHRRGRERRSLDGNGKGVRRHESAYAWIADKRLLGWQATHRGPVIPAEQILGPRSVVPGLPQLLEIIPDPAVAWDFLRQDSAFLDPPQRPIDALKPYFTYPQ
jgi:hypothetical protein